MISAVIPFYNEREVIEKFYKELKKSLDLLRQDYEIVFIDDGSNDGSLDLVKNLVKKDPKVKLFSFRRHIGKAEALTCGFQKASGDVMVTLDADLQDRPEEIKNLLKKKNEGWDMVSGWRKDRKDKPLSVVMSKVFNLIASIFWRLKANDLNCGLKVYSADAAKSLNLYGGMHRFIPLLLHQDGFKVTEIPVVHKKRELGKSKYGISKVFTELPDLFTMLFLSRYSKRPLHFFGTIGGAMIGVGTLILLYLSVIHFMGERIGTRPLLFLGILLVLGGIQIFFTGFLADLFINLSFKNNKNDFDLKYSSE